MRIVFIFQKVLNFDALKVSNKLVIVNVAMRLCFSNQIYVINRKHCIGGTYICKIVSTYYVRTLHLLLVTGIFFVFFQVFDVNFRKTSFSWESSLRQRVSCLAVSAHVLTLMRSYMP